MLLRVLGSLEFEGADGSPVVPAARKQRVLLSRLLLHANESVRVEQLVDALWEDGPPSSAAGNIKTYVWNLRRLMGPGGDTSRRIARDPDGYRLQVARDEVDVYLFEDSAARGYRELTAGRHCQAVEVLAEALSLWRGEPFEELSGTDVDAVRARLAEQRLTAQERLAQALVAVGRHDDAIAALRGLVAEHPLRERLRCILMTALHQQGRSTEALVVYEDARAALDRELGVLPGTELRRLHSDVLNHDVDASAPRPPAAIAQLPAAPRDFVGRVEVLRAIDAPTGGVVHVLTGAPGVGKTASALHWAHRNRSGFPDGQLFVNLRGHGADVPLTARQALEQLLQALDVDPTRRPASLDAAASVYRSALAGRRLLIVLDDAVDVGQVRPLLPGTPACTVLITSRNRLDGLVAHEGARQLRLDVLGPEDAREVLSRIAGAARVAGAPEAVGDLVALCGGLPLALRIAAAHLAAQPARSISDYVTALAAGDRLAALEVQGDPTAAVAAAVDLSYALQEPLAQRLFRLIGMVPGPDVTAPAVAALADIGHTEAEQGLRALVAANLVEQPAHGRYALHDLHRLYAADRAVADADDALRRLFTWYAIAVDSAADSLDAGRPRLPGSADWVGHEPVHFESATAALDWLTAEALDITAIARLAAVRGHRGLAWHLADALKGYFLRGNTAQWSTVIDCALPAAEADGHPHAMSAMHNSAGLLALVQGEHRAAVEHFESALAGATAARWSRGEITALSNLGLLHYYAGPLPRAFDLLSRADEIAAADTTGDLNADTVLVNLGATALKLGHPADAIGHLTRALAVQNAPGRERGRAEALLCLAETYLHLGDLAKVDDLVGLVAANLRRNPAHHEAAWCLELRARLAALRGDHQGALDLLDEAADAGKGHHVVATDIENTLAAVHCLRSRYDDAAAWHSQALTSADNSRYLQGRLDALLGLATVHHHRDDLVPAVRDATDALSLARETGHRHHEAQAHAVLGATHLRLGDHRVGADHAARAHSIHVRTGHRLGEARALLLMAEAARHEDDPTTADRHTEAARHLLSPLTGIPHDTRLSARI
ncbi:BTAD domain-containing putative transcriptional regulator [Actinosynnema sp. NPDC047251]|uniref:Transcriptional regulator, SARP family n=1 Tax=Saccharothrix espanaensis (strain ATCC 51144 / DSM 44229 / JCM 9112 / NBRC 15066 / NRRL 15764) TaxID=1179773 RepID=K0K4B6_SACES|nr:BTAD domain-containing putative transcriptional regulator [Saccharothrix espanaensis]CCH32452.1 hypothetical protein BN6_51860 [Saccharothrix espanaensis DSM 44229]